MKTTSVLVVGLVISGSAFAARVPSRYSERATARQYAQQQYGRLGKVTVARRPLLDTKSVNPLTAWGVRVDGKPTSAAVLVRGGVAGYSGMGIADVHKVAAPKGNTSVDLGSTFNDTIIVRTSSKATVEPTSNLTVMGEGAGKRIRSVAFSADWSKADNYGNPVAGGPEIMVFPGPSPSLAAKATVRSPKGTTEVNTTFQRYVIMAGR